LTATSPVQAATLIKSTNTAINFQGFSNAFKTTNGIPLNAVLNTVLLTAKGTSGGSVEVLQFSPSGPATVTSPGIMNLTVNGIMPLGQVNASNPSPVIVPAATLVPSYMPGQATVNVTPQQHTYTWNLAPGGTNPLSFFLTNSLTLQALAEFAPTIGGTPGAQEGVDSSTFQLDSVLPDTFLTFGYSIPASSAVPGPLPILGAASAFAFSRRMRSRIKQAS
jgi:hypothetical protein